MKVKVKETNNKIEDHLPLSSAKHLPRQAGKEEKFILSFHHRTKAIDLIY